MANVSRKADICSQYHAVKEIYADPSKSFLLQSTNEPQNIYISLEAMNYQRAGKKQKNRQGCTLRGKKSSF